MSEHSELFVMRNIHGGNMKYQANFINDILINVTRNGKVLKRGKDLYSLRKYAFAADAYGKSHTVTPKARKAVAEMRKADKAAGIYKGDLEQKGRVGGRPTAKARKKDVGKRDRQKRYEMIIRRVKSIRVCTRKEAQKVYRDYLPTIAGIDLPKETNSPGIVTISRAVSNPDAPITWLYFDSQSPKALFSDEADTDEPRPTYLRAVAPTKVTYGWVIKTLPGAGDLDDLWADSETYAGVSLVNTDYMVLAGIAADEDVALVRDY